MEFKTGNICRIYIKNFLTFNEVEVRPKPKLNFICGSNGSGKSTVLCAICLCLGGKATVSGRGKEVYEYVKIGKAEATLEVELYVEREINVVIMYTINKTSRKCTWILQGREVPMKTVLRKVEELNIQVDNLCQFLPQDRVANFAKMNCQELLAATQKGVGDLSLYEQHKTLCDSGQRLAKLHERMVDVKEEVGRRNRRIARLKDVVDNLKLKRKLEAEMDELQTQRVWYLYDCKRKIHVEHKEELSKKEKELKNLKIKNVPSMKKIEEKGLFLKQLKKLIKEKTELINKGQQMDQRLKAEGHNLSDKLLDAKRNFEAKQAMEEQRKAELNDYQRQLDAFLGQLQNLPEINEEEATKRVRELTDKIHTASQRIVRLQGQMSDFTMEKAHKAASIKRHVKELSNLQDVRGQRLELLKSYNMDAYKATLWLQNNKHKFKGYVYPPIFAMLNVKNQQYARYIENSISNRDLVAFVCEDKDDVNSLKEIMDAQGLCVNIVFSMPGTLDKFKPTHRIEDLKKYGFDTYLIDCVEAPPAILSFLCHSYHLHAVPVGNNGDYEAVPPTLRVFYLGNSRYSCISSRYDGQVTTSISQLGICKLLKIVQDEERISDLKEKIRHLEEGVKEDEQSMQRIKEEEQQLSTKLEGYRNEKRGLASRREERKMLEQRIAYKRIQIKRHEEEAIDLEAALEKMNEAVQLCIKNQVKTIAKLHTNVKVIGEGVCECLKAEAKMKVASKELAMLEEDVSETMKLLEEKEKAIKTMLQELEKDKLEGRDALKELMAMLGISSVKEITPEIRERFQNSSLEETDQLLAEKEAHLSCLITASAVELKEYREGQKELSKLKDTLEDVQHSVETHSVDMDQVKRRWIPQITKLVGDINNRFSAFMARMGYAGEVGLNESGDNFEKYGILLRVKFRDEQCLQQLTAQRQSGGERAVSTALYLLALQSLTAAPFRCVDEINQGMDKVNERKILEMLMETEGNDDCSQYFFVTPKLLQNLTYTEKVNVMVVFNSPTTLSHRRFTIQRILKRNEEVTRQRIGEEAGKCRKGANRSGRAGK